MAESLAIRISNPLPLPSQTSPHGKKRKRCHSPFFDLPVDGYTADIDEDSKEHVQKKRRKIKSKKGRKTQKTVSSERAGGHEDEASDCVEMEPSPKKKHYRKLSKDEKEDRRRSPGTLKLLIPLEDWFDSTDVMTVDEDEMDDVTDAPPLTRNSPQAPVPPPRRHFSTQYPLAPNALIAKSTVKAAGRELGRPRKDKDTPQTRSDVMSVVVASSTNMPIRGKQGVIDRWEESPGKLRGPVPADDDSERTENIAYSKHYIEQWAPNQTIKFENLTYKVVLIDPGARCDLSTGQGLKLCSLVRGSPVVVGLFSSRNREGKTFRMNTGGIWTIRGGQDCHVVNEGSTVGELFTFSEGEHEK